VLDPALLSRPGTVLLDPSRSDAADPLARCFHDPRRILTATAPEEVPALLEDLEAATAGGAYVAGYLGYEAGYPLVGLDRASVREDAGAGPLPLAWFGVYDGVDRVAPPDVEAGLSTVNEPVSVSNARLDTDRAAYEKAIRRIKSHIRDGDVYQINYTTPLRFDVDGDPLALYARLRARQHVPYGAYLNLGPQQILSCSPELFFRRDGDRLRTRPMKGTIRRGRTLEEDRDLREQLRNDPKNRAENLMIVDLLRNDLSVCCTPGSVAVPSLFETETYDTVTQMTSTVEGQMQDDAGLADVLRALFPCGSITGAPKRRAMEIIGALEPSPRGVYCGAIGYAGPDETATFSVAIRTAVVEDGRGTMGIGSGIVWDSDTDDEYEECHLKATFLTEAPSSSGEENDRTSDPSASRRPPLDDLRLIETMRFDGVRVPLLDRHLRRLERSADYFGIPVDRDRVRRRVETRIRQHDIHTVRMMRLTVDRWGRINLTTKPLEDASDSPWRLVVADDRVDSANRFLYHKTSRRDVYERAAAQADAEGADEAVLVNEKGEVTEGARSNVFVRIDGQFWTPPVSCGLLAGVYREHILDTVEEAGERILTLEDLQRADGIFCCNGVRGWRPAVLPESALDVAPPASEAA
jgi:para-aminobenzoate synthetase/4-amino-4-deoxychorismate lyase